VSGNPAAAFWAAIATSAMVFLGVTAVVGWSRAVPAVSAAPAQQITFEMSEFSFTPPQVTAAAGAPLTLVATNVGTVEHDLTVTDLGTTGAVPAGDSASLDLGPLEPGTYEIICSVPGHADTGMRATLTVTDGPAPQPVADAGGGQEDQGDHGDHGDHGAMTPEQMAEAHEQGVLAFPAATEGRGNQPLEPVVLPDGTKEFRLVAEAIEWEVAPGQREQAYAYNGAVPGPRIDVDLGDRVRIVLENRLPEPTAIHSHGLLVPNAMDGVPYLTQDPIMPGETFVYEYEIRNSGSHMYHSHFSADQVTRGLLGALVVHDPADPPVDTDYTMIVNDGPLGFTLNGKGFPATEPIAAALGQTVRIRYMNEGLQMHPMHLHGMPQEVVAVDGVPLDEPYTADTIPVAPGQRIDVLVRATEPGTWAFHCHILNHAESPDGMFGMVTAMVVQ
jgi:FtsP/CotA-like multicopper oxidase with cupredoxin domain